MGIINVTPDSFFAGSRTQTIDAIMFQAEKMLSDGATILDIGAQSTRPGAEIINTDTELAHLIPCLEALKNAYPTQLISVDTFNPNVAEQALKAGAHVINDISGGSFDTKILEVVSKYNAGYIAMHITGNQLTMHQIENRSDIISAIIDYMETKKELLASFGIENWVMDPGFGFGKTIQENFDIVKRLQELKVINLPILLGVSRKSSIYKTLGIGPEHALNFQD
jgi:dihydropteroate synthase